MKHSNSDDNNDQIDDTDVEYDCCHLGSINYYAHDRDIYCIRAVNGRRVRTSFVCLNINCMIESTRKGEMF